MDGKETEDGKTHDELVAVGEVMGPALVGNTARSRPSASSRIHRND